MALNALKGPPLAALHFSDGRAGPCPQVLAAISGWGPTATDSASTLSLPIQAGQATLQGLRETSVSLGWLAGLTFITAPIPQISAPQEPTGRPSLSPILRELVSKEVIGCQLDGLLRGDQCQVHSSSWGTFGG